MNNGNSKSDSNQPSDEQATADEPADESPLESLGRAVSEVVTDAKREDDLSGSEDRKATR